MKTEEDESSAMLEPIIIGFILLVVLILLITMAVMKRINKPIDYDVNQRGEFRLFQRIRILKKTSFRTLREQRLLHKTTR